MWKVISFITFQNNKGVVSVQFSVKPSFILFFQGDFQGTEMFQCDFQRQFVIVYRLLKCVALGITYYTNKQTNILVISQVYWPPSERYSFVHLFIPICIFSCFLLQCITFRAEPVNRHVRKSKKQKTK